MKWTTDKPTKPGWYWYKGEDPDIEHADGIAIVEVIKEEDRLVCRHSNDDNEWIEYSQAQWAGPLKAPE
jgi:hypothetical protein